MMHDDWKVWHFHDMWPWQLLWLAVLALVLVLLWRRTTGRGTAVADQNNREEPEEALRILNARFAKGEIDAVEYEARRKTLSL